jgi:hypothetical protein
MMLWRSNCTEDDVGKATVHFDCAHDLVSISVVSGEVVVDHLLS